MEDTSNTPRETRDGHLRKFVLDKCAVKRFMEKVLIGDDCWEWIAGLSGGYGRFSYGGYKGSNMIRSHILSYTLFTGNPPINQVLHSCNNRKCINPKHLRDGTPQDNADDRVKSRQTEYLFTHCRACKRRRQKFRRS